MTSPPYGKQRKKTYGGIEPSEYVDWFLPISAELVRVLKPTGSFVLNIKEHFDNDAGERHTYVLELILALRGQGWLWTEEYVWYKSNPIPGIWNAHLKDAWERCLHFTKSKGFSMHRCQVMEPSRMTDKDRQGYARSDKNRKSKTGSGVSVKQSRSGTREFVYPSNVICLGTAGANQIAHSAVYPLALPDWFIRLFTQEGDTVLDPFMGSGTTAVAALQRGRHYIGFDANEDAVSVARNRIGRIQQPLLAA
jgi:site-specific DNA-methyltransferase (adenine-specific)/site-specific DNA-methyltransferase (cytosine-N4-specific)